MSENNYEPPISEPGPIDLGAETLLAPGVTGYAILNGDEIWIPDIRAVKEGSGDVGRFLDSLSARCCVVNLVSRRLGGMLMRRGFVAEFRPSEDGSVDVWKRKPPEGRDEIR